MTLEQELKWIRAILRRGSQEAANQLIETYYDEIYTYVYRQVGEREDSLDLTQEIFIAALRSLPFFDSKKAGFRTWLYRIATHKVIDARRKVRLVTIPLEEEVGEDQVSKVSAVSVADDVSGLVLNRVLISRIEEVVRGLDPDLQEIFRLRLYGEYSFPEIARMTGEAEEKVKARYYRLVKRLRKEFDHDE